MLNARSYQTVFSFFGGKVLKQAVVQMIPLLYKLKNHMLGIGPKLIGFAGTFIGSNAVAVRIVGAMGVIEAILNIEGFVKGALKNAQIFFNIYTMLGDYLALNIRDDQTITSFTNDVKSVANGMSSLGFDLSKNNINDGK